MRRIAGLISIVMLLVVSAPAASALTPPSDCSSTDATFCLSWGASATTLGTAEGETRAAAPFDLAIAMANTSPAHTNDKPRWLATISADLLSSTSSPLLITPSADLPDGLLVAGTAAGCPPGADYTFSGCTAGYGAALADVSGTGGFFDGVHTATLGIQRITNVSSTADLVEYDVRYTVCVPTPFGSCVYPVSGDAHLVVPRPSGGPATRTFTMVVSGQTSFNYAGGTANIDYAVDNLTLNLHGTSDQLSNGSAADATYNVLRLPATCGSVSASGAATDRASAAVTVPLALDVVGCPVITKGHGTGRLPRVMKFAANATSQISGRTVTQFLWDFGDGTTMTGASPIQHAYPDSRSRTVRVVAVDSAGARSSATVISLAGSSLSLKAPTSAAKGKKIAFAGRLKSGTRALRAQRLVLLRCTAKGRNCKTLKATKSKTTGAYRFKVRAKKTSLYVVQFAGGSDLIGTAASRKVKVKHH